MINNNNQEKQLARVDVNIEKWGIFTTTHKTTKKSREIIQTSNNGKTTQKITIGKKDTTQHKQRYDITYTPIRDNISNH